MAPTPHITIATHPRFGIVAVNEHATPVADHALHRVGFAPVPDHPFHALTDPGHDATRRARQAVQALRAAGYTVVTDPAPQDTPVLGMPQGEPLAPEPEVAFGLHPDLGVIAAVTDGHTLGAQVLQQHGFRHLPSLDVYTLPPGTEPHEAVHLVARATRLLHHAQVPVAADPRIVLPPVPAPPSPVRPAHREVDTAPAPHPARPGEASGGLTARAEAARATSPQRSAIASLSPAPPPAPAAQPAPPRTPGPAR